MKKEDIFCKLFGFSKNTYYLWKREDNRPIIKLIDRYLKDSELEEFLEKNAIGKWEFLKNSYDEEMNENITAFKNILDDISFKAVNFGDEYEIENASILFMKIILFLSSEANPSRFYNISELIMIYAKKKDEGLSDSIIELNKIVSAKVQNKSFIPFLYELGRHDLMDLFDNKIFSLGRYGVQNNFIHYILPYWNLKYKEYTGYKKLEQTGYHMSLDIFDSIFSDYIIDGEYTKREIIKMFKEYYQELKK